MRTVIKPKGFRIRTARTYQEIVVEPSEVVPGGVFVGFGTDCVSLTGGEARKMVKALEKALEAKRKAKGP